MFRNVVTVLLLAAAAGFVPATVDALDWTGASAAELGSLSWAAQPYLAMAALGAAAFLLLIALVVPAAGVMGVKRKMPSVAASAVFCAAVGSAFVKWSALSDWQVAVAAGVVMLPSVAYALAQRGLEADENVVPFAAGAASLLALEIWIGDWALRYPLRYEMESSALPLLAVTAALLASAVAAAFGILAMSGGGRADSRGFRWTAAALTTGGLMAAYLASPAAGTQTAATIGSPPGGLQRVILLSVDTLRPDYLSFYNSTKGRTPNLDRLAADSTVFVNAFSPSSWTIPAMASIATGFSPMVHGLGLPREAVQLPTMAERFSENGYRTAAFLGNALLMLEDSDLLDETTVFFRRGFDVWRPYEHEGPGASIGAGLLLTMWPDTYVPGANTRGLTEGVLEWVERNQDQPFFLWAHYLDPHWPYAPPVEWAPKDVTPPAGSGPRFDGARDVLHGFKSVSPAERAWARALYDAEVHFVDDAIGRLIERLRELDLYDGTLIVLTSDHGEELWEHGRYGHGHAMYAETVRAPLAVKMPGVAGGRRVETPVSTQAIAATALELAGLAGTAETGWATSLAPLMEAGAEGFQPQLVVSRGVHVFEDQEAVVMGRYRYIRRIDSGIEELFDIESDPSEMHSILASFPQVAESARQRLDQINAEALKIRADLGIDESGEDEWDEDTLRRLKNLGYL